MRDRFRRHRQFERHAAHHQQVERAVVVVGREQPVERQQARQQRAQPQDRRTDAREQSEVGAERERHHGHDDQEKQRAHQRAAADANGEPHVAQRRGR